LNNFYKERGALKIFLFVFLLNHAQLIEASEFCTYSTWSWNVNQKRVVNNEKISKSKSKLSPEEKGTIPGCSVCEEDQREIRLPGVAPFKVCQIFHSQFQAALQKALNQGFPIYSVSAYRVGKSKGAVNAQGERTEFSNHSYGTAIDINSELNGLYDQCEKFSPACRLVRGGNYNENTLGAITSKSSIYSSMREIGFKWGGEIAGRQKDFMHFSTTGY
jgi:hypothetical protein